MRRETIFYIIQSKNRPIKFIHGTVILGNDMKYAHMKNYDKTNIVFITLSTRHSFRKMFRNIIDMVLSSQYNILRSDNGMMIDMI
jgi:hypothetical protein